jgi:predicted ArsR family transcriptional regulator
MNTPSKQDSEAILSENVPVVMPELPATLSVSSAQQFKAAGDPTRMHILDIIKHQPTTAKQLGTKLNIAPSTIGHHLQVLEAAGMAQVVARRFVHGIVAKYYTRTARLFLFDFPPEGTEGASRALNSLAEARNQLADSLAEDQDVTFSHCKTAFPHALLSHEQAEAFNTRLFDLIYEFATLPPEPDGQVYAFFSAFFIAPSYLQSENVPSPPSEPVEEI